MARLCCACRRADGAFSRAITAPSSASLSPDPPASSSSLLSTAASGAVAVAARCEGCGAARVEWRSVAAGAAVRPASTPTPVCGSSESSVSPERQPSASRRTSVASSSFAVLC